MKDPAKLHELFGETVSLITPSGFKIVIRQQTGDDDDILSNAISTNDGTSVNKFITSIVVDSDIVPLGKLIESDTIKMKLCDKYYILLASRIFSLGQIMKFEFKWDDLPAPISYEEDLSKYIWDYNDKDFPLTPDDPKYFEYRIKPHLFQKDELREFTISSGKQLRYRFSNGDSELYMLKLPIESRSKNKELLSRDLHLKLNDKWVKVENFKSFTSTEMLEIRNVIYEEDPDLELFTELEHPVNHNKIQYPIIATTDFFFPREI